MPEEGNNKWMGDMRRLPRAKKLMAQERKERSGKVFGLH